MGDILTERQKAERLAGDTRSTLAVLFPCPQCGHANRPARTKVQSIRLYLLDQLPPCRQCGAPLRRSNFDRSTIPPTLLKRAAAQIRRERVIQCFKCGQKLRAPADQGSVSLRCPSCKATFNYIP